MIETDPIKLLENCTVCPRRCGVNRLKDERGYCGIGRYAVVASHHPHLGEEPPLVGRFGSGTIFLSGCNLRCVFCQNYDISHGRSGRETDEQGLADTMLYLEGQSCHNINFVSPSHCVPQILKALELARDKGLSVPAVYNSGGYDLAETIELLEGWIQIYMPDFKYGENESARTYSDAPDYFDRASEAVLEMHRQTGDLRTDSSGTAVGGLLVRHLVMPGNAAASEKAFDFIANSVSKDTYINVMNQYYPAYRAGEHPGINRPPGTGEYARAMEAARKAGLHRFSR